MKLLNVWPQEQTGVQPKKRLWLEMILMLLAVSVVLLSSWLWLNWRLLNATDAHRILKTEWVQLNQSRAVEVSSGAQMPQIIRQSLVGQLDWMGELPQWLIDHRVHWISAQFNKDGLKLVGMARDGEAISAMLERVKARYPNPPAQIRELSNVQLSGQAVWRFEMSISSQTLQSKVDLITGAEIPFAPLPRENPRD